MIEISDEVARALDRDGAVVALESTIISHGMPHPHNVETALQVEADVIAAGAVPAARSLIGATNPVEATPGSIRGDLPSNSSRVIGATPRA